VSLCSFFTYCSFLRAGIFLTVPEVFPVRLVSLSLIATNRSGISAFPYQYLLNGV